MYHKYRVESLAEWRCVKGLIRTNVLRGKMVENGITALKMADELGITVQTFYNKMRKGVFDSDEIYKMIGLLSIDNPVEIFFADEVAEQDTYDKEAQ